MAALPGGAPGCITGDIKLTEENDMKKALNIVGGLFLLIGAASLGSLIARFQHEHAQPAAQSSTMEALKHREPPPAKRIKFERPNTVMKIPAGRYEAIDNAEHILLQLCQGKEQCAVRFTDLQAFREGYAGRNLLFGQIDLAEHHEYAAMRAAREDVDRQAAKSTTPGKTQEGQDGTIVTQIAPPDKGRGYFDTCQASNPNAVTYVLKTELPDLIEGVICSAEELQEFVARNVDGLRPQGKASFATDDVHDLALKALRLDEATKPSMVTVFTRQGLANITPGSGFVVGVRGDTCEIATSYHVTEGQGAKIFVTLADGSKHAASVALAKPGRELTILNVSVGENAQTACKPLAIGEDDSSSGQLAFMGTIPLPAEFNPLAERWTRGVPDNIGVVTEVKSFAPLPGLVTPYEVGQDVFVESIQGYPADSGSPAVDGDARVIGLNFSTKTRGGVTLVVPARFLREALAELHAQSKQ
jgi:S1-C subfamily serine protease